MLINLFVVFIGAGAGAVIRYMVSLFAKKYFLAPWLGTFAVNVLGCFLIGLFLGIFTNKDINIQNSLKLLVVTGFLGGLTTFSTFNFEAFEFFKAGKVISGLFYMFLSCFVGLVFTYLGYLLSKI